MSNPEDGSVSHPLDFILFACSSIHVLQKSAYLNKVESLTKSMDTSIIFRRQFDMSI